MRAALSDFPAAGASHAGQLLGPLFDGSEKQDRSEFLKTAAEIKPSAAYAAAFRRWGEATRPTITVTTSGPLAIGLGNASSTEVGLTLHHTYGVPCLPGSALKGLARRAARDQRLDEATCKALFGDVDGAAHVIWWDGWLDPDGWLDRECKGPLQLDTMTVHHPKYYGSAGKEGFPTDFDDPNPVAFLSVPIGTKFHIALGSTPGLDPQWLRLATELLGYGLKHLGLGGKTNAGYGGFGVVLAPKPPSATEVKEAAEEAAQLAAAQAEAAVEKRAGRIREDLKNARAIRANSGRVLGLIAALPPAQRQAAVQVVVEQANKFGEKELVRKAKKLLE